MKRARFLTTAAAATLAGCSAGGGGSPVLPSTPASPAVPATSGLQAQIAADAAAAVPATTLANPIVGEAVAFMGKVAPAGWAFATGQTIPISQNRPLFAVLGASCGGDGKTTFGYPSAKWAPFIVAIAGTSATSPEVFVRAHRDVADARRLPAGWTLPASAPPKPPSAELLAQQALLAGPAPRSGASRPLSIELRNAIRDANASARATALGALGAATATRLATLVAEAVGGTRTIASVADTIATSLTGREAEAVLAIGDASEGAFRGGVALAHANPRFEAARYLGRLAFTPDQVASILDRESP